MSRECTVTGAICHNPECQFAVNQPDVCAFKDYPFQRSRTTEALASQNFDAYKMEREKQQEMWNAPIQFGNSKDTTIAHLAAAIDRLTKGEEHKKEKPIFALTILINKSIYIMANVNLVIGSPKTGIFTLIDNKTLLPITTASFSGQAVGANSNPEFATFALDPANPNNLIGTPVAAGTGTVVITTSAAWTDAGDGSSQTGAFSVTKTFVVAASQDGASFDVVFP